MDITLLNTEVSAVIVDMKIGFDEGRIGFESRNLTFL